MHRDTVGALSYLALETRLAINPLSVDRRGTGFSGLPVCSTPIFQWRVELSLLVGIVPAVGLHRWKQPVPVVSEPATA